MLDAIHQDLLNGNAAAAEQKARELLAQRPKDGEVYRTLAAAQNMTGNRDGARATIEQGLEQLPDDAALHFAQAGLYLEANDVAQAAPALAKVTQLDPNFFPAYVLQAQLAMAHGQVEEAERIARVANRVSPDHPQLHVIEGQVALARGDMDRALQFLSAAARQMPGDPRVLRSLGMAYMGKQHYAFAEQTFTNLLEREPQAYDVRALLIDAVRLQGRAADALKLAEPLLTADAPARILGNVGVIALEAGQADRGIELLERAVRLEPGNQQALASVVQAWQATGKIDQGRALLDELLSGPNAQNPLLWQARLATEEFAGDAAVQVIERWRQVMPTALEPLQARAVVHDVHGERAQGDALAQQIIELQPLHADAQLRLLGSLLEADPQAAVTRAAELRELFKGQNPQLDDQMRGVYSSTLDRAGRYQEAADIWLQVQAEGNDQRLQLTEPGTPRQADEWAPLTALTDLPNAQPSPLGARHRLLWGPPGSLSEFVGYSLAASQVPLLTDRFTNQPPNDYLQSFATLAALDKNAGEQAASDETVAQMAGSWVEGLAARGAPANVPVVDALLLWDYNFLQVLRAHPNHAELLVAIRDPRDMLLHWLAFPGQTPFRFESVEKAADWLAAVCNQVADIEQQKLYPLTLIRLDDAIADELSLQTAVTTALGAPVQALDDGALQHKSLPKGHWRHYAPALQAGFDRLKDVAVRLGYAEA
ncbi:tetratricopeptide repeat protein [Aquilutibacter rugosus]|uniref:tetratricopeptide repeat protein n=1 Tax=Aquilutibacter rugosus TaxID=3115820 RepID=UPI002F41D939